MKTNKIILFALLLSLFWGCKRESPIIPTLATINVFHAVSGLGAIKINYVGQSLTYSTFLDSIIFGTSKLYPVPVGDKSIKFVLNRDSSFIAERTMHLNAGDIYSVYFTGTSAMPDTIFRKEKFVNYPDSVIGIRVINLSQNSPPLTLSRTIIGQTDIFPEVSYKEESPFQIYQAGNSVNESSYVFQLKDPSGSVLTTFRFTAAQFAAARFRQVTLAIRGLYQTTAPSNITISYISNY